MLLERLKPQGLKTKTIRARLIRLYVPLLLLIQIPSLLLIEMAAHKDQKRAAKRDLEIFFTIYRKLLVEHFNDLSIAAASLAADSRFLENIDEQNLKVVSAYLEAIQKMAAVDLALIVAADGTIVVPNSEVDNKHNNRKSADRFSSPKPFTPNQAFVGSVDSRFYKSTAIPLSLNQSPPLWLVAGLELNEEISLDPNLASVASVNLLLLTKDVFGNWQLSRSNSKKDPISSYILENYTKFQDGRIHHSQAEKHNFAFLELPLNFATDDSSVAIVLYHEQPASYDALSIDIILISVVGLIILIIGSFHIAGSISKPLSSLIKVAIQVKESLYRKIPAKQNYREFTDLADMFSSMTEGIQERENLIGHQLHHDAETGLPNLRHFEKTVENEILKKEPFDVLNIRIERLKDIRTTIGHTKAYMVVQQVSGKLLNCATKLHGLSRLSTTTFGVIVPHTVDPASVIRQIDGKLRHSIQIDDAVIDIHIRMGLASFPIDTKQAEDIIRLSEIATTQAKREGKKFAKYDLKKDTASSRTLSLMSEMQLSLADGGICFHYQPKLDLGTGNITQAEALMRWHHPTIGFIAPKDFIPLAEDTGHIHHLTSWALHAAIRQATCWRSNGLDMAVAVNISAQSFSTQDLVSEIANLLGIHQLPPNKLILEVTESSLMRDPERTLCVLTELHDMGVLIAIDDYGTGYSCLSYLKNLPVDEIKIDKSFVQNINDNEEDKILVRSTIDLAHQLSLQVTAEGIENRESRFLLDSYGCDKLQGHHISKPLSLREFEAFVAQR